MKKLYQKIKENIHLLAVIALIVIIIILVLFNRIVIIIRSGEAGVLYKLFFGGTVVTKVYSEGIHFIYPWNTMKIYNVRVQAVPHEFDVLTKDGLKLHLFISIRYYPEYRMIGVLHKTVGPDYVNTVVIPEIENVLRVLIGQLNAEEVYTTKQAIIEKSISEAIERIAQRYINVDNVIIKQIQLPAAVDQAIQNKITQKHLAAEYEFKIEKEKQEKDRKEIEAEGLKIFHKSLTPEILRWMGIEATLKLAESPNSKIVIIGGKDGGLPLIGNIPIENFIELRELPSDQKSSRGPRSEKSPETADVKSEKTTR